MNYEKFVLGKKYRPTLSTKCYTCVGFRTDGVPILEGGNRSLIVPSDPHNWVEVREPRECWIIYVKHNGIKFMSLESKEEAERIHRSNSDFYEIVHMKEVQDG